MCFQDIISSLLHLPPAPHNFSYCSAPFAAVRLCYGLYSLILKKSKGTSSQQGEGTALSWGVFTMDSSFSMCQHIFRLRFSMVLPQTLFPHFNSLSYGSQLFFSRYTPRKSYGIKPARLNIAPSKWGKLVCGNRYKDPVDCTVKTTRRERNG